MDQRSISFLKFARSFALMCLITSMLPLSGSQQKAALKSVESLAPLTRKLTEYNRAHEITRIRQWVESEYEDDTQLQEKAYGAAYQLVRKYKNFKDPVGQTLIVLKKIDQSEPDDETVLVLLFDLMEKLCRFSEIKSDRALAVISMISQSSKDPAYRLELARALCALADNEKITEQALVETVQTVESLDKRPTVRIALYKTVAAIADKFQHTNTRKELIAQLKERDHSRYTAKDYSKIISKNTYPDPGQTIEEFFSEHMPHNAIHVPTSKDPGLHQSIPEVTLIQHAHPGLPGKKEKNGSWRRWLPSKKTGTIAGIAGILGSTIGLATSYSIARKHRNTPTQKQLAVGIKTGLFKKNYAGPVVEKLSWIPRTSIKFWRVLRPKSCNQVAQWLLLSRKKSLLIPAEG